MRSRAQLAAENLFLRKQLAMYQERRVKPRRSDDRIVPQLDRRQRLARFPPVS
jgi:hypothetical protein